jgi:hypothetical protein
LSRRRPDRDSALSNTSAPKVACHAVAHGPQVDADGAQRLSVLERLVGLRGSLDQLRPHHIGRQPVATQHGGQVVAGRLQDPEQQLQWRDFAGPHFTRLLLRESDGDPGRDG